MTAYWITIYKQIIDEARLAAYAELAGPALEDAGGSYVVRGLPDGLDSWVGEGGR